MSGGSGVRTLGVAARVKKIQAMSAGEIASRMHDRVFGRWERMQHARGRHVTGLDGLRQALHPELRAADDWRERLLQERAARPSPFFPGIVERDELRQLFPLAYADELDAALREAQALLDGRISFFGETFPLESRPDWHADPVSGRRWPVSWHADVPINGGNRGYGDVKYVWEINRHQFLVDLAKAFALDGDERAAARVVELVTHWIAENPYGVGVNWSSPLEPAFRGLSWLFAYRLLKGSRALTPQAELEWLGGFVAHGRFLHRHLEYYASPFNHLAGEACALYLLGTELPQVAEAASWRSRARRVLESRLEEQFYADGGGVEQATFYHHATLGFYLLAALQGRASGDRFSAALWDMLERATEHAMYMTQPDGRVPAIGDADDGKCIRFEPRPFWDFRAYLALGAVLFSRGDFKFVSGSFTEDALWLLGPDGRARYEALDAREPAHRSHALQASGYYLLRSDWTPSADFVCFDCGELAYGARHDGIPNAVHGHADALSVAVHLGGRPVLVDAGFFTYNGEAQWEDHFRKTAAHNTVLVDGRDQARHLVKMAWSDAPRTKLEDWMARPDEARVVGSHDGYARGKDPLTHRRLVWYRSPGYVVLLDELTGSAGHDVEVLFHFAPGRTVLAEDRLVLDGWLTAAWSGSAGLRPTTREGGPAPWDGWIAPSLGLRTAVPRLSLAARMDVPFLSVLTVLADTTRVQIDALPAGSTPAGLPGPGWRIVAGAREDRVILEGGAGTPPRLTIVRLEQGRVVQEAGWPDARAASPATAAFRTLPS